MHYNVYTDYQMSKNIIQVDTGNSYKSKSVYINPLDDDTIENLTATLEIYCDRVTNPTGVPPISTMNPSYYSSINLIYYNTTLHNTSRSYIVSHDWVNY